VTVSLLDQSRALLERGGAGVWQRAVAVLARQALEAAVARVLAARAAGTESCSARAQLLCLPTFAPTEPAHEAAYLWHVLSRVCHHHPYELAPTAAELAEWLAGVERVVAALEPAVRREA
jgi:hypothetical protein